MHRHSTADDIAMTVPPPAHDQQAPLMVALERFGFPLLCTAAFLMPIKLPLTYIALVPLISLWLGAKLQSKTRVESDLLFPLQLFALAAFTSSLFGINPERSIPRFSSLIFFSLAIPMVRDVSLSRAGGPGTVLLFCLGGQSLTALYAILNSHLGGALRRLPIGALTQSGQLAVLIPLALGAAITAALACTPRARSPLFHDAKTVLLGTTTLCLLTAAGFSATLNLPAPLGHLLFIGGVGCVGAAVLVARAGSAQLQRYTILIAAVLPILGSALLVNLKRGPWLGVFCAVLFILLRYGRRFIAPLIVFTVAALLIITPVRERIADSSQHFFISGGRSVMWQIGGELVLRYPLGIGYHNSPFLRKFDPEIPPQHNHFHNNALNIVVETGWIGLALFCWWIARLLRVSLFSRDKTPTTAMMFAIGCAVISWQLGGVVEYNFGDSEVVQIIFLALGLLEAELLTRRSPSKTVDGSDVVV